MFLSCFRALTFLPCQNYLKVEVLYDACTFILSHVIGRGVGYKGRPFSTSYGSNICVWATNIQKQNWSPWDLLALCMNHKAKRSMVQVPMKREKCIQKKIEFSCSKYLKLNIIVLKLPKNVFSDLTSSDLCSLITWQCHSLLNIRAGGKIHWWVGRPQGTHMPMWVRQVSVLIVKKLQKHLLRNMVGTTWYVPLHSAISQCR